MTEYIESETVDNFIQKCREDLETTTFSAEEIKSFEEVLLKVEALQSSVNQMENKLEESNLALIGGDLSKSTHDFESEIKYILEELSIK